jgi:hypothetical protein
MRGHDGGEYGGPVRRFRKRVADVTFKIVDLKADIQGATGPVLHGLAKQLEDAQKEFGARQASTRPLLAGKQMSDRTAQCQHQF